MARLTPSASLPMPRLLVFAALVLVGCSGARPDTPPSAEGYGLSPQAAILVGAPGGGGDGGPTRERAYLDRLRGPSGAPVSYERIGSCCGVPSDNSPFGLALLDMYEVWGAGTESRVTLYLNMYDPPGDGEADRAPPGFTLVPA